jgi:hypothetical protein
MEQQLPARAAAGRFEVAARHRGSHARGRGVAEHARRFLDRHEVARAAGPGRGLDGVVEPVDQRRQGVAALEHGGADAVFESFHARSFARRDDRHSIDRS